MRLFRRILPEARAWCGICEYVAGRLTGHPISKADSSILASFGGFDPVTLRFRPDFAASANGEKEEQAPLAYPFLADSFSLSGTTPDKIPVAFPVGDNQASFYGLIAKPEEECLVSIGTSGQISIFSKSSECPASMELRPFFGLGYIFVGATISAGKSYETMQRFFKDIAQRYAALKGLSPPSDDDIFEIMKSSVMKEDMPDGILVVDTAFSGARQDDSKKGSVTGITLNNLTMGNVTASTVAGIIRELAGYSRGLELEFSRIRRIITAGNAIKNPLFRRELEKQFSAEICVTFGLGAALIGAVSAELIKPDDVDTIIRALRENK